MSNFTTIEVDGQTYYYDGQRFFDGSFLVLQGTELQKVTEAYYGSVNYQELTAEDLLSYIKKLKGNGVYFKAKTVMLYGMEKYQENEQFLYRVLPIFTSCCREMNNPREAIRKAKEYFSRIESSVALCTSLASAYCDIKDYENAKKYARLAYAKQGGGQGYKTELSLVFLRLKKETGENLFDE